MSVRFWHCGLARYTETFTEVRICIYMYIAPDNTEEMSGVFLLQSKKVEVTVILFSFGAKETTDSI